jgi:predicted double-glycine peptidase
VSHPDRYRASRPLPPNLIPVPLVKQATDFSCGAAATLALLRYWRRDAFAGVGEASLYEALGTSEVRGTDPEPIAAYVRRALHQPVEYRHDDVTVADLERAVDAREPPIVDLQAWSDVDAPWDSVWDAGHYVVLVGYDAGALFFLDPSTLTPGPYAFLTREELEARWHDVAGDRDDRFERMAIFVRGDGATRPRCADEAAPAATPLG